jgi:hypothetical protein
LDARAHHAGPHRRCRDLAQRHLTTTARVDQRSVADLSMLIMFPKLYRRLVKYFKAGHRDLTAFDTWLRADPISRDDRVLLPIRELGTRTTS